MGKNKEKYENSFLIDKQTLHDLNIFESYNEENSIIGLFRPISLQGKEKLKAFFKQPSTSRSHIQERLDAIRYIARKGLTFEIDKEDLDFIEHYLSRGNKPTSISVYRAWEKGLMNRIKPSNAYYIIRRGVSIVVTLLKTLYQLTKDEEKVLLPTLLQRYNETIFTILDHPDFALVDKIAHQKRLNIIKVHYCDYLFRYLGYERLRKILDIVYQLDIFQAAAMTAKKHQFCYPELSVEASTPLSFQGLFHPFLNKPVPNDVSFNHQKNVCFVTGSNMAGKSTFLKAVGISIYLAHLGLPVPAVTMRSSVMNGLMTTINISDTLQTGYSHFYSEVMRVKEVALAVNNTRRIMVIFDELFRGTNVKDAFDASKAIIEAFTNIKDSLFMVSTHIIEVAHTLKANPHIDFKFMETNLKQGEPQFSYELKDGITEERIGMWIVKREKILEIIYQKK